MKPLSIYTVSASLPSSLIALKELAYNFWWCWNDEAASLFGAIDSNLWLELHRNPVALLNHIPISRLEYLENDKGFIEKLQSVHASFISYINSTSWFQESVSSAQHGKIAYFSLEFGINESFPNYSGGLGILAGDHLKSASDLGLPLVAVGLLYQMGYFRQHISSSGWQTESFFENDFYSMPLELMKSSEAIPYVVEIAMPNSPVYAHIWRAMIGKTALYLLDTNIIENAEIPEYRDITDQLYGGNTETRIQQEIVLGIGGIKALRLLGIHPSIIHINEGHAAFATRERAHNIMHDFQTDFYTAMELAHAGMIFTTHTPVPAGNEVFPVSLIDTYFSAYWHKLGISREEFLQLGQVNSNDPELFSMTVLALRMSSYRNGVSALHGKVARSMWQPLWPDFLEEEIPIHHITNGIHTSTWVAGKLAELFDTYLGSMWRKETHNKEMWKSIGDIPSDRLWKVHEFYKSELVDFARTYLQNRKGTILSNRQKAYINRFLNPQALTIGFARRFATYKRANLLFRDMGRLKKMLTNPDLPVQIILAGKAHPHDNAGKEIIQSIIHAIKEHGLEDHIIFLEDYSMAIASAMVKGCDIWLNTPRRPHEASGTSGMKAAMNGCLHCSIMDGWWDESYNGDNGFSIGSTEQYASTEDQDRAESLSLYEILEQEIIPTFYNRNKQGIPEQWVEKMKSSIMTIAPEFSTARMVRDYTRKFYLPALQRYDVLQKNNLEGAKQLRNWKKHIYHNWEMVSFGTISIQGISHAAIGKHIKVYAEVYTGNLSEKDLLVEAVYGKINAQGDLQHVSKQILTFQGYTDGKAWFEGQFLSEFGGQQGCTVRVLPTHTLLTDNADIGLCTWAKQQ